MADCHQAAVLAVTLAKCIRDFLSRVEDSSRFKYWGKARPDPILFERCDPMNHVIDRSIHTPVSDHIERCHICSKTISARRIPVCSEWDDVVMVVVEVRMTHLQWPEQNFLCVILEWLAHCACHGLGCKHIA